MTETAKIDKSGAPPCGLYLRVPANARVDMWVKNIQAYGSAIKHRSGFTRNMHAIEIEVPQSPTPEQHNYINGFAALAAENGLVAVILCDDLDLADTFEADGVIVTQPELIAKARKKLGEDAIVGLQCGHHSALAAQAHKDGADYITLGDAQKACEQAQLIKASAIDEELLCAAIGPITNDTANFFVQTGVNFIDCTDYACLHEKGFMQGAVNMLYAVSLSLDANLPN